MKGMFPSPLFRLKKGKFCDVTRRQLNQGLDDLIRIGMEAEALRRRFLGPRDTLLASTQINNKACIYNNMDKSLFILINKVLVVK